MAIYILIVGGKYVLFSYVWTTLWGHFSKCCELIQCDMATARIILWNMCCVRGLAADNLCKKREDLDVVAQEMFPQNKHTSEWKSWHELKNKSNSLQTTSACHHLIIFINVTIFIAHLMYKTVMALFKYCVNIFRYIELAKSSCSFHSTFTHSGSH